jgi:hypothetical protein
MACTQRLTSQAIAWCARRLDFLWPRGPPLSLPVGMRREAEHCQRCSATDTGLTRAQHCAAGLVMLHRPMLLLGQGFPSAESSDSPGAMCSAAWPPPPNHTIYTGDILEYTVSRLPNNTRLRPPHITAYWITPYGPAWLVLLRPPSPVQAAQTHITSSRSTCPSRARSTSPIRRPPRPPRTAPPQHHQRRQVRRGCWQGAGTRPCGPASPQPGTCGRSTCRARSHHIIGRHHHERRGSGKAGGPAVHPAQAHEWPSGMNGMGRPFCPGP